MQELPSLAYQLLLLSTRGPKRAILKGLVSLFEWRERKMRDDPQVKSLNHLRQVQVCRAPYFNIPPYSTAC